MKKKESLLESNMVPFHNHDLIFFSQIGKDTFLWLFLGHYLDPGKLLKQTPNQKK